MLFFVYEKAKLFYSQSSFFAFNTVFRDRWVKKQAEMLRPGAKVLDIGAGSCPYRPLFAHCDYFTQDFTKLENSQLRHKKYGSIDYVCDINGIPVPNASFDVVLCTEVLEHVPEPKLAVQEMARILRPGGKLILTAPLGSGIHQEPYHYYGGYTPFWYFHFLKDAGFEFISVEANAGFFRHYAQESLRFVAMTRPLAPAMPAWLSLAMLPFWLPLGIFFGLLVPLVCAFLDRFDQEQKFTVGYHVTAVRKNSQNSEVI